MPSEYPDVPNWARNDRKKVLVLSSSPRLEGNSRMLAHALADGAREAGHEALVVDLPLHLRHMLDYCRNCRGDDGECQLDDNFRSIFLDLYVSADAIVFATPIWWYGMSAHMKNFVDRMSCYVSGSSPHSDISTAGVMNKPMALLLSAEESSFSTRLGLLNQFSELCRHLKCDFVGSVTGTGNLHGEIEKDPMNPVAEARLLGMRLFSLKGTSYELDSPRSVVVWPEGHTHLPSYWR